jgi:hypothetical protein
VPGVLPAAEDLLGQIGHDDRGKDRQQLTDKVPADTAQVRCPRQSVGHLVLLAAEDMANDLFAVLGVNLRRIHSAVGQPVPVPGRFGLEGRGE